MKGYKWVFADMSGRRVSWGVGKSPLEVTYSTKEYAEAPDLAAKHGYFLTFFDTEEHARSFLESPYPCEELWEVDAQDIMREFPPQVMGIAHVAPQRISAFLENEKKISPPYSNWPPGTLMAKRIKLVRRLWPPEDETASD